MFKFRLFINLTPKTINSKKSKRRNQNFLEGEIQKHRYKKISENSKIIFSKSLTILKRII